MDCNKDIIEEVLTQAQQIGMVSEDHFYLLTSLDAHTVDLHSFKVCIVSVFFNNPTYMCVIDTINQ